MNDRLLCFVMCEAKFAEKERRVKDALVAMERREGVESRILPVCPSVTVGSEEGVLVRLSEEDTVAVDQMVLKYYRECGMMVLSPRWEWLVAFEQQLKNPSRAGNADWYDLPFCGEVMLCEDFS